MNVETAINHGKKKSIIDHISQARQQQMKMDMQQYFVGKRDVPQQFDMKFNSVRDTKQPSSLQVKSISPQGRFTVDNSPRRMHPSAFSN